MKIYCDTDYIGKYKLFNESGKEEILNWIWFDPELNEYAFGDRGSYSDVEIVKNTPFIIKENPYEKHVWFTSKNFRKSRLKLEFIEKSGEYEILKKAYRSDRWDLKVRSKEGEIINFRAFPGGSPYVNDIKEVLSKVGSEAIIQFKEVVK